MDETETYIVTLPISGVEADMAGMPAEWLERAIRAVGRPQRVRITQEHAWSVVDGELEHTVTELKDTPHGSQ